jgi:hypothetical protein
MAPEKAASGKGHAAKAKSHFFHPALDLSSVLEVAGDERSWTGKYIG